MYLLFLNGMPTYLKLKKDFNIYLEEYKKQNGDQTILQIRQIAKQYAIDISDGIYSIIARKRYTSIFNSYIALNNLDMNYFITNKYDPDSEFTNDPDVLRLVNNARKRLDERAKEFIRFTD